MYPAGSQVNAVSLPWETIGRLWSIADMIEFFGYKTFECGQVLQFVIIQLHRFQDQTEDMPSAMKQVYATGVVDMALQCLQSIHADNMSVVKVQMLRQALLMPDSRFTPETLGIKLEDIRINVGVELGKHKFAFIPGDNAKFFEQEKLFGERIYEQMAEARQDIKDAGNCIAASLHTAAVFHLMRIAEHGLRVLAKKFRVSITHKGKPCPIELGDWEQIITGIKNKITLIRQLPKASKQRQVKLELYSDAADHCTFMKDIWRNNTAHVRKTYKHSEAIAIFDRVRDFMQFLETNLF